MLEQLKPELRFPEFEVNWERLLIQDCLKIGSGRDYKHLGDGDIPVYGTGGLMTFVDDYLYEGESVGIGRKGTVDKPILLDGKFWTVDTLFYTHSFGDNIPYFFYNIFLRINWKKYIEATGVPSLTKKTILKIPLIIPNPNEQQKIANFLKAIDKRIKLLKAKKDALEEYKTSIMQKLFSQEIRFKQEDGSDFPDWENRELGEIGEFKTSSVNKKIEEDEKIVYLVNYMNVYRHEEITNANKNLLMQVSAKESQIEGNNLEKGDILFTPSSETPTDIGHSVVIKENLENTLYSYHLLRFRPSIPLDIGFSHYFCNDKNVLKQITKFASGSTRFTISLQSFAKVKVNIPAVVEQRKIAAFLSSIDKRLEKIENLAIDLECFKKSMLQKLFI